jgi:hypothetical protein
MTRRTATYLRRVALATLFAAAATFSGSAFGDPAVACAAPREWDIGAYDACSTRVDDAWIAGAIPEESRRIPRVLREDRGNLEQCQERLRGSARRTGRRG